MGSKTTSPDYTGVSLKIDGVSSGSPAGSPVIAGHLIDINPIIDKQREVKKYTPLNENEFDESVSLGSLIQGAFTASVLYDPEASEGVNDIETAIDENSERFIIIELPNKLDATGTGTTYEQLVKVSSFKVEGEDKGKLKASFSAERIGTPTITAATAGA